jgi:hypothetical protein
MKKIASTTGRGEVSGGESGDELGGLSDLELDDIFDNLDKPEKGTGGPRKTKSKKEISEDLKELGLEGLGLEDLLDELDAVLNGKAPVFKTVIVANKSWWVPEEDGHLLAVQIDQPEQYQQAIIWKMAKLAQEWGFERALESANIYLRQEGSLTLPNPEDEEQLVKFVIQNNSRIAEKIQAGDPEVSQPAPPDEARYLVENQEMNWEDFLT